MIGGSMLLRGLGTITFLIGDVPPTPVTVDQDADLIGRLEIELAPDADAGFGETLLLIDIAGARTNQFNNAHEGFTLATTAGGIDLVLTYAAGDGNDIGLIGLLAGDVDGDGSVGVEDLDLILANWGSFVGAYNRAGGDLSGDGVVGEEDLQGVLEYWGSDAPPTPTIPEPTSLLLFGLGVLAVSRVRR